MSKAVVFFADGTEECEALLVVDLLRRARVEVIVASAMGRRELVSSHKIPLTADALAEEVDYSDVDMVVLPGGIPGTPNLAANKTVTETCAAFAKAGRKVAAICAAPSILASLGLLCHPLCTGTGAPAGRSGRGGAYPERHCVSALRKGMRYALYYLPLAGRRGRPGDFIGGWAAGLAAELAGPEL